MKKRNLYIGLCLGLTVTLGSAIALSGCGSKAKESSNKTTEVAIGVETTKPVETVKPTETPTEKPVEQVTQKPTEKPTEAPTQKPTEAPTEKPTEKPVEKVTQKPVAQQTEKPTQAPTQAPTPKPTEKPTQAPTPKPADPSDEFLVDDLEPELSEELRKKEKKRQEEQEKADKWIANKHKEYMSALRKFLGREPKDIEYFVYMQSRLQEDIGFIYDSDRASIAVQGGSFTFSDYNLIYGNHKGICQDFGMLRDKFFELKGIKEINSGSENDFASRLCTDENHYWRAYKLDGKIYVIDSWGAVYAPANSKLHRLFSESENPYSDYNGDVEELYWFLVGDTGHVYISGNLK